MLREIASLFGPKDATELSDAEIAAIASESPAGWSTPSIPR